MHNKKLYQLARDTYLETRNLQRTLKIVKQAGYVISYSTLKKWKKDNDQEWKDAKKVYDSNLAKSQVQLADIENELLKELLSLKQGLADQKGKILEAKRIDSQGIFAMTRLVEQIMKIVDKIRSKDSMDDKWNSIMMDVLFEHPVIGPIVMERKKEVNALVEKRLRKNR